VGLFDNRKEESMRKAVFVFGAFLIAFLMLIISAAGQEVVVLKRHNGTMTVDAKTFQPLSPPQPTSEINSEEVAGPAIKTSQKRVAVLIEARGFGLGEADDAAATLFARDVCRLGLLVGDTIFVPVSNPRHAKAKLVFRPTELSFDNAGHGGSLKRSGTNVVGDVLSRTVVPPEFRGVVEDIYYRDPVFPRLRVASSLEVQLIAKNEKTGSFDELKVLGIGVGDFLIELHNNNPGENHMFIKEGGSFAELAVFPSVERLIDRTDIRKGRRYLQFLTVLRALNNPIPGRAPELIEVVHQ
jgi:hypothetical protein